VFSGQGIDSLYCGCQSMKIVCVKCGVTIGFTESKTDLVFYCPKCHRTEKKVSKLERSTLGKKK